MFQADRWTRVVIAGLLLFVPATALCGEKYKLEEPVDDVRVYGVGTRVNITGTLKFPKIAGVPESVAPHSQTGSAAISYRERRLLGAGSEAELLRSVREYEIAQADFQVADNKTSTKLPDGLKLIVAQGRPDGVELYAINGLLTSDELFLIRSPADSLVMIALLPATEVEIGDKWTVPGWAFQMLAGLDAVVKGELVCTFDSVEKGLAKIKMEGNLEGAAVGALTEVKVTGSLTYNIQDKYIAESDFVQSEKRVIGPVSPGMDIVARVRLLRQPSKSAGKLVDQKILETAKSEPDASAKLLRFESPWNIGLQHGRHWYECAADEKVAVFRLFQEGNLVAECDMASIPAVKPGGHLAEQAYLAEIRKLHGDRIKTMTNGEVVPSSDRKFVYKVMANGVDGERQVTWIFYLVADPSGRQASLMFSVDTPQVETLSKFDREIVDSLKFGPAPVARAAKN